MIPPMFHQNNLLIRDITRMDNFWALSFFFKLWCQVANVARLLPIPNVMEIVAVMD